MVQGDKFPVDFGAPAAMSFDTKVTDLRARMEVARWLPTWL